MHKVHATPIQQVIGSRYHQILQIRTSTGHGKIKLRHLKHTIELGYLTQLYTIDFNNISYHPYRSQIHTLRL